MPEGGEEKAVLELPGVELKGGAGREQPKRRHGGCLYTVLSCSDALLEHLIIHVLLLEEKAARPALRTSTSVRLECVLSRSKLASAAHAPRLAVVSLSAPKTFDRRQLSPHSQLPLPDPLCTTTRPRQDLR